ncbi:uncharacterized protein LOC144700904 [Wolffia australiana]
MARPNATPRPSSSRVFPPTRRSLLRHLNRKLFNGGRRPLPDDDPPSFSAMASQRSNLLHPVSARKLAAMIWHLQISNPPLRSSSPVHGSCSDFNHGDSSKISVEKATKWNEPAEPRPRLRRLQAELDEARSRISELEAERRALKSSLDRALDKVTVVDELREALAREKKMRRRLETANAKLVDEIADAELTARRRLQELEGERRARELAEEVCEELVREMGDDKAELEALRGELAAARDEAEDERKMLQLAEVWREERVQMKLVDARLALEEKWAALVELEARIRKPGGGDEAAKAAAVQEIGEFSYQPLDDVFAFVKELRQAEDEEAGEDSGWETMTESPPPLANGVCRSNGSTERDGGGGGKSGSGVTEEMGEWGAAAGRRKKAVGRGRVWQADSPLSAAADVCNWGSPVTGKKADGEQVQCLKAKLLEARLDSRKVQLRQALRQKI